MEGDLSWRSQSLTNGNNDADDDDDDDDEFPLIGSQCFSLGQPQTQQLDIVVEDESVTMELVLVAKSGRQGRSIDNIASTAAVGLIAIR